MTPPDHTELRWTYEPSDFFEAPFVEVRDKYDLEIRNGRVVADLRYSCDPLADAPALLKAVKADVEALFAIRRVQVHRPFQLKGPSVYRPLGGIISMEAKGALLRFSARAQAEFTVRDANGNIIKDSRAERIAAETAMLNSIAPKVAISPLLAQLLESYARAVDDPRDEFVHLYEIRDAMMKHFGGRSAARTALGISEQEWERLDDLLNDPQIDRSRHRGKRGSTVGRPAKSWRINGGPRNHKELDHCFRQECLTG